MKKTKNVLTAALLTLALIVGGVQSVSADCALYCVGGGDNWGYCTLAGGSYWCANNGVTCNGVILQGCDEQ